MEGLFKLIKFLLWITLGIIIVPCAVISATVYPVWEKMRDEF